MSAPDIERELKAALDEGYRPAPWLLDQAMTAVRQQPARGRPAAWLAGAVAVILAVTSIAVFESVRLHQPARPRIPHVITGGLPEPVPQPVTRTSRGAQVAWLAMTTGVSSYMLAVSPAGKVLAEIQQADDSYGVWRSADGATVFVPGSNTVTALSALDGKASRVYRRDPGVIVGDAFSADGRQLAILTLEGALELQVVDLESGALERIAVPHDANAALPGEVCQPSCAAVDAWGLVLFSPDSTKLYALTDWGGPVRLTAFSVGAGRLSEMASSAPDAAGFATCGAPAMAAKVIDGGRTLVAFCHGDGAVWFFDLAHLTETAVVKAKQPNPFWLSPIFTPDGHLLYLHQWAAFGDSMQVVDLATRRLLGPVATPATPGASGPFAGLISDVYAGGVASTVPLSPDGLELYSATGDGIMVLRVPDLKPIARLAPGFNASEVWVSGDGMTLFATSDDGKSLVVMRSDGSSARTISLPAVANGFVASEHG